MQESGADRLGNLDADEFLCLSRGCSEMRCEDQVGNVAVGPLRGEGLHFKDVEGCTPDLAALEPFGEDFLVDEAATGTVDKADTLFEQGQLLAADHMAGLLGEGHVNGDEVRQRKKIIDLLDDLDLKRLGLACGNVGIVGEDAHAEGDGTAGYLRADAAHAEDGDGLAVELHALEFFAVPLAGLHAGVCLRDIARNGEHQGEGVLGGGDCVAAGGVHDNHAVLGGSLDVDIVDTDSGTADDLEVLGGLENLGSDLGLAADDQPVELWDDLDQFILLEAGFDDHLDNAPFGKGFDSTAGDGIGD